MVKVTRTSQFTGRESTMEINITQEELDAGLKRSWSANPGVGTEHMQNIFPQLSADEREFLMTGCHPDEWNEMFSSEEDDE